MGEVDLVVARATQERNSENGAGPRWKEGCVEATSVVLLVAGSGVFVYSRGSIVSPYCFRYSWFRARTLESVGCFANHFSIAGMLAKVLRGTRYGIAGSKAWVWKVMRVLSGSTGRGRHRAGIVA